MNRAGILKEALLRATHACLWAEEQAIWHTDLEHARARRQSQARVERVLTQAAHEDLIGPTDQRRLLGVVMDALVQVRWRHEARHMHNAATFPVIEASLEKDVRQAWSQCVRNHWWRRAA